MNYIYCLYSELLKNYNVPQIIADITFFIIPLFIIFCAILIIVLILVLAERKLLGFFTQRKGPNRVGYWGLLQTIADAFKLLCKENITPKNADRFLFNLSPILMFTFVPVAFGLLPLSSEFTFMKFGTNALLYLILVTFPILCIFAAGWASNNKYSLIGAFRNISQIIAYELPMAFSLLSVVALSSSMNLTQITYAQSSNYGFLSWFIFPCFIGFIIMFISMLAELNRCPFDLPEAESELICGYNTEYSGMRFAMFYLSEYSLLFTSSVFISILFLGGYLSPFGFYISSKLFTTGVGNYMIYFEQVFWLFLKASLIIFITIWIRATLPRLASFDLIRFSWNFLLPLSILNFLVMVLLKYGECYA